MCDHDAPTPTAGLPAGTPPDVTCVRSVSLPLLAAYATRQATRLAEAQGASAVLVIAANRNMVQALRRAGLPASVDALTFDKVAQLVLTHDGSAKRLGRTARVLLPAEEKVLLEDMKVSGIKVRRLREELKFLFKGLSEGSDADEDWLVNNEERGLLAFLRAHLEERGAILTCERGNLMLRCLLDAGVRGALARPHIIAFGFTALDRCGQTAVCRLATQSLTALGCDEDAGVAQIDYPYPQGLTELVGNGARLVDLDETPAEAPVGERGGVACPEATPSPAHAIGLRLLGQARAQAPLVRSRVAAWDELAAHPCVMRLDTPTEEFAAAARWAAARIDGGTDASELIVVVPNVAFARGIAQELQGLGVPFDLDISRPFDAGDPRRQEGCGAMRFLCALGLLSDPGDVTCWRSWLGCGDWLLRSDAWEALRRLAQGRGRGILDVLDDVRSAFGAGSDAGAPVLGPTPEQAATLKLTAGLRSADELLATCAHLRGAALVDAIARLVGWEPGPVERAILDRAGGDDAASLYAAVRTAIADGGCERSGVAIVTPDRALGSTARAVLITGMVDGYLPGRGACDENDTLDHQALHARKDRRRLLALVGMAQEDVSFSCFSETDLETAERSHLDVGRVFVRAKEQKRRATAKPSSFFRECLGEPQGPGGHERAQA